MPTPAPKPMFPAPSVVVASLLEVLMGELVADGDAGLTAAGAGLRSRTWLCAGADGLPQLVLV